MNYPPGTNQESFDRAMEPLGHDEDKWLDTRPRGDEPCSFEESGLGAFPSEPELIEIAAAEDEEVAVAAEFAAAEERRIVRETTVKIDDALMANRRFISEEAARALASFAANGATVTGRFRDEVRFAPVQNRLDILRPLAFDRNALTLTYPKIECSVEPPLDRMREGLRKAELEQLAEEQAAEAEEEKRSPPKSWKSGCFKSQEELRAFFSTDDPSWVRRCLYNYARYVDAGNRLSLWFSLDEVREHARLVEGSTTARMMTVAKYLGAFHACGLLERRRTDRFERVCYEYRLAANPPLDVLNLLRDYRPKDSNHWSQRAEALLVKQGLTVLPHSGDDERAREVVRALLAFFLVDFKNEHLDGARNVAPSDDKGDTE